MRGLVRTTAAASMLLGAIGMGAGPLREAAAAAAPECGTATLRASIGGSDAGAGNIYTTLVLRNIGHATCLVRGYPGVSLLDRQGHQIGRAAARTVAPARTIVLRPGGAASTVIHTLNPGVGTNACLGPSVALRVYPPDQRKALLVPALLSECLGMLEVRPLVAGSTGM